MKVFGFIMAILLALNAWAQTKDCWPNSRGDIQLNGITLANFPQKISLKWTYDADGIFKSAAVTSNNKIVVGSTNGDMLCLDFNGKLLWKFESGNAIEAPALIENNIVYFGNLNGTFYALDLETGKIKWEYKTENQIMGAPTLFKTGSKTILAVGSYDYYLHGVDAQTGEGIWKYESDNFLNSAPAIYMGKAVFGGCDGFLHLVNMTNGLSAGKIEVASYVASSPAIVGSKAYIGDYDAGFTCIDLDKKKIVWRHQNKENGLPFIASPSVVNNKILIGNRDKFFYCFDQHSGKILWKKNTGSRIDASAVANSKQVLLINMRGDLMLLNHADGSTVWSYELGAASSNSPAVINKGIIVAGIDGNIYFLGE